MEPARESGQDNWHETCRLTPYRRGGFDGGVGKANVPTNLTKMVRRAQPALDFDLAYGEADAPSLSASADCCLLICEALAPNALLDL